MDLQLKRGYNLEIACWKYKSDRKRETRKYVLLCTSIFYFPPLLNLFSLIIVIFITVKAFLVLLLLYIVPVPYTMTINIAIIIIIIESSSTCRHLV